VTGEITLIQTVLTLADDIINLCAQKQVADVQQEVEKLKRFVEGFDALVKVKQDTINSLQQQINDLKGVQ
jgi:peptidoglycan hydrolase CwlO-like protein